jgi:hypothetical protein
VDCPTDRTLNLRHRASGGCTASDRRERAAFFDPDFFEKRWMQGDGALRHRPKEPDEKKGGVETGTF